LSGRSSGSAIVAITAGPNGPGRMDSRRRQHFDHPLNCGTFQNAGASVMGRSNLMIQAGVFSESPSTRAEPRQCDGGHAAGTETHSRYGFHPARRQHAQRFGHAHTVYVKPRHGGRSTYRERSRPRNMSARSPHRRTGTASRAEDRPSNGFIVRRAGPGTNVDLIAPLFDLIVSSTISLPIPGSPWHSFADRLQADECVIFLAETGGEDSRRRWVSCSSTLLLIAVASSLGADDLL